MPRRAVSLAIICAVLGGCTSMRVPRVDLTGLTLPKFEIFRYGVADPNVGTAPYTLTPADLADIKRQFSAEFTDGRTLEFGPINARRKPDGALVVCGLVNIRSLDRPASGMRLFDGTAAPDPFGGYRFSPYRLANVNAKPLDIYSGCRDAGVL